MQNTSPGFRKWRMHVTFKRCWWIGPWLFFFFLPLLSLLLSHFSAPLPFFLLILFFLTFRLHSPSSSSFFFFFTFWLHSPIKQKRSSPHPKKKKSLSHLLKNKSPPFVFFSFFFNFIFLTFCSLKIKKIKKFIK